MRSKATEEVEVGGASVLFGEESREIYVFGPIDDSVANRVIFGLREFESQGKGVITLVLSSGGGEEAAGWAIYDALALSPCRILAECYGECMSIAVLVLQACDTRLAAPNCRLMVHNGTVTVGATNQDKIRNINKEIETMTNNYYEKLADRSELSIDKVKRLCDNETFMSAEEALQHGLIDGILGRTKRKGKR